MSYDVDLADRVREVLETTHVLARQAVSEKRMFGGLAFLVEDYLALAVTHDGDLLLRVDPADEADLRERPHVVDFVMRDKPVSGWLRVCADGCADDAELREWVACGVGRAQQLPARQSDEPAQRAGA